MQRKTKKFPSGGVNSKICEFWEAGWLIMIMFNNKNLQIFHHHNQIISDIKICNSKDF